MNESSFRSYFREHDSAFSILEPPMKYESAAVAREHVETLLEEHPDLCGLFISGGGIAGAIAGLRDTPKREDFVAVGYEFFDQTRAALIDGVLTFAISHPMEEFGKATIEALLRAKSEKPGSAARRTVMDFEISKPESI